MHQPELEFERNVVARGTSGEEVRTLPQPKVGCIRYFAGGDDHAPSHVRRVRSQQDLYMRRSALEPPLVYGREATPIAGAPPSICPFNETPKSPSENRPVVLSAVVRNLSLHLPAPKVDPACSKKTETRLERQTKGFGGSVEFRLDVG